MQQPILMRPILFLRLILFLQEIFPKTLGAICMEQMIPTIGHWYLSKKAAMKKLISFILHWVDIIAVDNRLVIYQINQDKLIILLESVG